MGSYNKRISDQSKIKFDPINRELIDSENSELDARVESLEENITGSKTATGNPLTVTDAAPVNAVNLSMNLEPIQEGSGEPSPDNIRPISGRSEVAIQRVGKNLVEDTLVGARLYSDGAIGADSYFSIQLVRVIQGLQYTVTVDDDYLTGGFFTSKPALGSVTYDGTIIDTTNKTFIAPITGWLGFRSLVGDTTTQCELGTTATTYEPYAGKTYTIQLGQTVYGGQLDVTRGKMVVDRGYIASYNGETLPSTWISDRDVYASGTTPTIGAEVVYELAEPFTIDLTPQQIKLLENTNTITTDYDGDVLSLEYQPNNAFGELLGEVNNIYDSIIEDIYDKIDSLDTRVTALEE